MFRFSQSFKDDSSADTFFLPDFCSVKIIFVVGLLSQLLTLILVLAPIGRSGYEWTYLKTGFLSHLALTSLFVLCVALLSSVALCFSRTSLSHLQQPFISGLLAWLIILIVTTLCTEITWKLDTWLQPKLQPHIHHLPFINLMLFTVGGGLLALILHHFRILSAGTLILLYTFSLYFTFLLMELAALLLVTNPEHRMPAIHQLMFLVRNLCISALVGAITLRYLYIQYHWRQQMESASQSRIQALQARIRPHFLFNSMNTIASLIRFYPQRAEQAVEDLAQLFRASLSDARTLATFSEEKCLCEQYLAMEKLRLDDRLQVIWQTESIPSNAMIPLLSLQPLLENAVYHGIQPLPEGGIVRITGLFDGKQILLDVENPLPDQQVSRHKGNRIALHNINQRLWVSYGHLATLTVRKLPEHYVATLRFPYRTHADEKQANIV